LYGNPVDELAADERVGSITEARVETSAAVESVTTVTVAGIEKIAPALAPQSIGIQYKAVSVYFVSAPHTVNYVAYAVTATLEDRVGIVGAVARLGCTLEVARERNPGEQHRQERHRPDEQRYLPHIYLLLSSLRPSLLPHPFDKRILTAFTATYTDAYIITPNLPTTQHLQDTFL